MKKTDWFPMSTPPVRDGVYEVGGSYREPLAYPFHYFSVKRGWHDSVVEATPDSVPADCGTDDDCSFSWDFYVDNALWRGLAKDPAKAKK